MAEETKKEFRRKILILFISLTIFGMLGITMVVAWVSRDLPDPDRLTDRQIAESTKIYDRTGEQLLYEIFADEKRTMVDLDEIPARQRYATRISDCFHNASCQSVRVPVFDGFEHNHGLFRKGLLSSVGTE